MTGQVRVIQAPVFTQSVHIKIAVHAPPPPADLDLYPTPHIMYLFFLIILFFNVEIMKMIKERSLGFGVLLSERWDILAVILDNFLNEV